MPVFEGFSASLGFVVLGRTGDKVSKSVTSRVITGGNSI